MSDPYETYKFLCRDATEQVEKAISDRARPGANLNEIVTRVNAAMETWKKNIYLIPADQRAGPHSDRMIKIIARYQVQAQMSQVKPKIEELVSAALKAHLPAGNAASASGVRPEIVGSFCVDCHNLFVSPAARNAHQCQGARESVADLLAKPVVPVKDKDGRTVAARRVSQREFEAMHSERE